MPLRQLDGQTFSHYLSVCHCQLRLENFLPVSVTYINDIVVSIIPSIFRHSKRMQPSSHELCVLTDVVQVVVTFDFFLLSIS